MKQFFKYLLASVLGFFLSIFLLFFIFSAIFGVLASSAEDGKEPKITENSILHLELKEEIKDRPSNNPFETFDFAELEDRSPISLSKLISNIEKAKKDDRVTGIYLDIQNLRADLASIEAIRRALEDFKSEGKFIIAYSENYSQGEYFLQSVADEIYLHPAGNLIFKGLSAQLLFFKDALNRLELDMQVIRHGKYKSAIEPFTRNDMSPENREQWSSLINGVWSSQLDAISKARNLSIEKLNKIADSLLIRSPEDAKALGLVDGLLYEDELLNLLTKKGNPIGSDEDSEQTEEEASDSSKTQESKRKKRSKKPNLLALSEFNKVRKIKTIDGDIPFIDRKAKDKIAVIFAEGEIISGKSKDGSLGSETIAEAIKDARKDKRVKAIVLRVNSPGGSALASDVIWRETKLAKAEKPLIVSMGDLAASGGYYISCSADKIFAETSTITGSIGVFGLIPNMQGTFNKKLGIHTDRVNTNAFSDGLTALRPLAETERMAIRESIEKIYDDFTQKVAEGRNMEQTKVDDLGQGRIWSGLDAKRIGLVDELGGLEKAIEAASELAELDSYKIKELPEQEDPMKKLLEEFSNQAYLKIFGEPVFGKAEKYYSRIKQVFESEGIYTRLPVEVIIE